MRPPVVFDGTAKPAHEVVLGPGLAAETRDFQTLLELHRRDPNDEATWTLLQQTRAAMEASWMERLAQVA